MIETYIMNSENLKELRPNSLHVSRHLFMFYKITFKSKKGKVTKYAFEHSSPNSPSNQNV